MQNQGQEHKFIKSALNDLHMHELHATIVNQWYWQEGCNQMADVPVEWDQQLVEQDDSLFTLRKHRSPLRRYRARFS